MQAVTEYYTQDENVINHVVLLSRHNDIVRADKKHNQASESALSVELQSYSSSWFFVVLIYRYMDIYIIAFIMKCRSVLEFCNNHVFPLFLSTIFFLKKKK